MLCVRGRSSRRDPTSPRSSGWTFASPSNRLLLEVKISDNGGSGVPEDAGVSGGGVKMLRMRTAQRDGASLALGLESVAYVDGSAAPVDVILTRSGNIYGFSLPHFNRSVWYDPTVSVEPSGLNSGAVAGGPAAVLAAAVAAAVALLGAGARE